MVSSVQAAFGWGEIIVILTFASTWIFFAIKISIDAKKERKKIDDEFAKKADVLKDLEAMDKRIDEVKDVIENNRKDNLMAHREIRNDIMNHIDTRFDDIKDLVKTLKSA